MYWSLSAAVVASIFLAQDAVAEHRRPPRRPRRPRDVITTAAPAAPSDYWTAVAGAPFADSGTIRKHYIQAEEVTWDYAPCGSNLVTGEPFSADENVFVQDFIGSKYTKCLYFEYAGAAFGKRVERAPEEEYLGLLGPVLRAEVGDRVEVVFRNRCSFRNSVHLHGLFYDKGSEGAPHDDGSVRKDMADDMVAPGGNHTYRFTVPERAGPGPADGTSIVWLYHSHTDEIAGTYAGLVGPLVVTRKGAARADGGPADVDRELFTLWVVMNENLSALFKQNTERFPGAHRGRGGGSETAAEEAAEAEEALEEEEEEAFEESNLMHAVNGYVYGNMPEISVRVGERVRWYVFALGTEVDLHTPHWHGNTALVGGRRRDEVELLPATQLVADMVPDNPGKWLMHCHVNDHLAAGMIDTYTVLR